MTEQWKQIAAICALSFALSGCGLKGDLYIPVEGEAEGVAAQEAMKEPQPVEEAGPKPGEEPDTTDEDEPADATPAP